MSDEEAREEAREERAGEDGARWKYPIAALIVATMLGLVVYVTYRTGEIPYTIAGPLLAAGLWGALNFKMSDFRGQ